MLGATSIDNIGMGCQAWVNEANEFLKIAQKGVSATQFRKEKEQLTGQIKVLTQQLDILKAEVERLRTTSQHVDPSRSPACAGRYDGTPDDARAAARSDLRCPDCPDQCNSRHSRHHAAEEDAPQACGTLRR